ncbi:hypothetical protein KDL01_05950 [Actinospica durhamensis]|uniref:Uncharacterized protein n=1 Tax=Actinospica durhamensis TaxID=1508375 RepID=A0A941EPI7_9ACTN|nr:hypothetical protein [Actinospica durhamensis]MBR7832794.1 hypothetical protein [Actinospica durhamensis]
MNPNEKNPLICCYLFTALAVVGILGIFATSASTAAVVLFVGAFAGVIASTAALVQVEQGAQRPASRSG